MMISYISTCRISPTEAPSVVDDIVAGSIKRNSARHITGALMFTGEHFAQILEGKAADVDAVMASILADPRHDDIIVMTQERIVERSFGDWTLAYAGPSRFVARNLERLRHISFAEDRRWEARWLRDLLLEFARENQSG
jgi:hypothetical protein